MMGAREWLEQVRECAGRLDGLAGELRALEDAKCDCLPWQCKGSTLYASMGGSHSDPTASEAAARIEGLDAQIGRVRSAYDECVGVVGECLRVLDEMRRDLGKRHADAIELYYVDRADTWSEVAWEMRCHRDTVRFLRDAAIRWIDENSASFLL